MWTQKKSSSQHVSNMSPELEDVTGDTEMLKGPAYTPWPPSCVSLFHPSCPHWPIPARGPLPHAWEQPMKAASTQSTVMQHPPQPSSSLSTFVASLIEALTWLNGARLNFLRSSYALESLFLSEHPAPLSMLFGSLWPIPWVTGEIILGSLKLLTPVSIF